MRERLLGPAVLLALLAALSSGGAQEPTKANQDKDKDRLDADGLPPGFFAGELRSVPSEKDRSFVVRVRYGRVEVKDAAGLARANGRAAALAGQISQLQAEAARSVNPDAYVGRLQALSGQLQRELGARQNLIKVVPERKDVTFHAAPDLVVRFLRPPGEFDEKGDIKTFTPSELRALKGKHPDLPGYEAKESDLQIGQFVRVSHGNPAAAAAGKSAVVASDTAPAPAKDGKVRATLIMILADSAPDPAASKPGKKK
jgi:hypothetical protein